MGLFEWIDRLFDPPPKELRKARNKASIMLYYQAEDEGYRRYKHLCYQKLILEALLAFGVGLLSACVLKL